MSEPNDALRRARERRPSSRLPGAPTSRDELATCIREWVLRETGEIVAVDERAIGRWERGRVRTPGALYRAALRAVLGVEHDWELGFAASPSSAPGPPVRETDLPDVEAIRDMASSVHVADRRHGGGRLYATVLAYLQSDVARAVFAPSSTAQVFAAAASLTETAGWMAHDSGRDVDARTHFDGAYRLALAATSPGLAANMCASMAHLAGQLGMVEDSVRLAEAGLRRLDGTAGIARVAARLHAVRARGFGLLGEQTDCRDALRAAELALEGPNGDQYAAWCAHFDEWSLAAERATALHALGDLAGAERSARVVLDLRTGDRVRALAFGRLTLAFVLLDAGRVDEALDLGRQVSDVAASLASARVRSRLGDLALTVSGDRRSGPRSGPAEAFRVAVENLGPHRTAEVRGFWPV